MQSCLQKAVNEKNVGDGELVGGKLKAMKVPVPMYASYQEHYILKEIEHQSSIFKQPKYHLNSVIFY